MRGTGALTGVLVATEIALIATLVAAAVSYGLVYIARGLDDVAYHIPTAVRIAQSGAPYRVDSPVDSHWYPAVAETTAALFIAATGSIDSTNITGTLCFVAICLLTYLFAGLFTRESWARLACVVAAASTPLLLGQCLAFYVDIHLAALILACLYLQARSVVCGEARQAYAALALAMLLPGVKYGGAYPFVVVVLGCVYCIRRSPPPRRPSFPIAALILAAAAFSAGFYVRNWLERGNPIYPLELPGFARPLAALSPSPYEADAGGLSLVERLQSTKLPYPWIPQSWPAMKLKPDMMEDAFGATTTLCLAATLFSLFWIGPLDGRRRGAWILALAEMAAIVALFPLHASGPRFVLFVPLVLSLAPAVLAAAAARATRLAAAATALAVVLASAIQVSAVLLRPGEEWTRLAQAASLLVPYRPNGRRAIDYAQRGHLRIGYTSGYNNMIALLYDRELTNTLVPLHYADYELNHGRGFATREEFLAHVESLQLDYIQIFDPAYPGAAFLRLELPEKTWVWDRTLKRSRPSAEIGAAQGSGVVPEQ